MSWLVKGSTSKVMSDTLTGILSSEGAPPAFRNQLYLPIFTSMLGHSQRTQRDKGRMEIKFHISQSRMEGRWRFI